MADSAIPMETLLALRWRQHSDAWVDAVRERRIGSRIGATDQALIDAILTQRPTDLLDLGCGEGWLARRLHPLGIGVTGIDAEPRLIHAAQQAGIGTFRVANYGDLPIPFGPFAMAVSNFALLGDESVRGLFASLSRILKPGGHLIVQTLHPLSLAPDHYQDGWREDSWAAFSAVGDTAPPWYFRTLQSWAALFRDHHLKLIDLREPMAPGSITPASILFIARRD
ncbi:class I SAM-dependent DNA methyltransferase [Candidatus Macondimonas diazotrophica]|nr:class I SAM-dependent methyltransferase [Candidatus Macondimonas diazotrophica]